MEKLTLKWGTIKGYANLTEKSIEILKRFYADGVPISVMLETPTDDRRAILCELIDQLDGKIWNDWEGTQMTKDEAKKYVTEYGK